MGIGSRHAGLGGTRNGKDAPQYMGRVADGEVYDKDNEKHRERERSREREKERDRDRCADQVLAVPSFCLFCFGPLTMQNKRLWECMVFARDHGTEHWCPSTQPRRTGGVSDRDRDRGRDRDREERRRGTWRDMDRPADDRYWSGVTAGPRQARLFHDGFR
jgi:hypothetical protein